MIITATQKQIPVTPRKMRMMVVAIKDLKPQEAIEQLNYLNYAAAEPLKKVIKQALANATNNHKINPDTLTFKEVVVNQGWTLKKVRAGARGRGKPYTRRRSHVTVTLKTATPKTVTKAKSGITSKKAPKKTIKKTSQSISKLINTKSRSAGQK